MTMYTLDTRYARFEGSYYKEYPKGAPVDLSADEIEQFAAGVAHPVNDTSAGKPVFRSTVAQPKKEDGKDEAATSTSTSTITPTTATASPKDTTTTK